jgi:hypothetical protein
VAVPTAVLCVCVVHPRCAAESSRVVATHTSVRCLTVADVRTVGDSGSTRQQPRAYSRGLILN